VAKVAAVVLAAGRSSRWRSDSGSETTKLIAPLEGKPIVRRVVESAVASHAAPVVVVLGYARESVEAALAGLSVTLAFNADYVSGLASSLRVGLAATPADADAALVLLGDMPRVEARLVNALIAAFAGRPDARAVAPFQHGRRGNPVLLARALFDRAMRLEGDEGARRLLAALDRRDIVEIFAPNHDAAFDIDTPGDLAAAKHMREDPRETRS
jgi:molybdenum cofactor cytidylyltransferase